MEVTEKPMTGGVQYPDGRTMFTAIGLYMVHWSSFELAIDIATMKLSQRPASEIVRETGGHSVMRKVNYLRRLVQRVGHPQAPRILILLDKIPSQSIRNSIAHSYMRFGVDRVEFIHRRSASVVRQWSFTLTEFNAHLWEMSELAHELSTIFDNTDDDAERFIAAAIRID